MAPDRGQDSKPGRDMNSEKEEEETGSLLPFALVLGLCVFIGADKLGLLGASPFEFALTTTEFTPDPFDVPTIAATVSTALAQQAVAEDTTIAATISRATDFVTPAAAERRTSGDNPQHNAMLFLFNAIILGTGITQLLHLRWFRGLQQTVVLFLVGVSYSLLLEGLNLQDKMGVFGNSYEMWMAIDPHLLLFTMLPPLLAGDAMSMDTAIARRVSMQWLYLAGPGVLINGFLTALFLWTCLPYDWPFLLCLTTGAILCATDPVAVVALLKELGAPPALTVQIQGESLLNDGTAIVLYQLTYNMLQGEKYDASDILWFFAKTACLAWILGLVIGWLFYLWIKLAGNKLEHHSAVIQISLTLCCAYWSFLMSEGVFHMSGVLATVASSLVLADKMWPVIVCKESMHTVWHMFEYLGNVVVFFLAGALTGQLMVHMPLRDYFYLVVIYIMLMLIRGSMLMCSRPIMNRFAKAWNNGDEEGVLSVSDCLVMTWGGLRGAVGLALAIQVSVDRAGGEISEMNANRVLFYTGGVAALTLIINATSCPALVKFLRIAQMPETKKRVLLMVLAQLTDKIQHFKTTLEFENLAVEELDQVVKLVGDWIEQQGGDVELSPPPPPQPEALQAPQRISKAPRRSSVAVNGRRPSMMQKMESFVEELGTESKVVDFARQAVGKLRKCKTGALPDSLQLLDQLDDAKRRLMNTSAESLAMIGDLKSMPLLHMEADLGRTAMAARDSHLVRAFHEVFLNLVNGNYWKFIEAGDVVPGTSEAEVLLCSVKLSLGSQDVRLHDLKHIQHWVDSQQRLRNSRILHEIRESQGTASQEFEVGGGPRAIVQSMVDTLVFQFLVIFAIMANAVFILLEAFYKSDTNDSDVGWIVADCVFAGIFLLEFVLKYISMCKAYFKETWNIIDFILVWLGLGSIVLGIIAKEFAKKHDVTGESRLVRLARVLRVVRLMRVFRLLRLGRAFIARVFFGIEFSKDVAERVQILTMLNCFIKAHTISQEKILSFFGRDGKVEMPELARVIVESMVEVYQAFDMAITQTSDLAPSVLQEILSQKRSKAMAESLDTFVQGANEKSIITAREAEKLLKPVHKHLRQLRAKINEVHLGYLRHDSTDLASASSQSLGEHSEVVFDNRPTIQGWQIGGSNDMEMLSSTNGFLVTQRPSGSSNEDLAPTGGSGRNSRMWSPARSSQSAFDFKSSSRRNTLTSGFLPLDLDTEIRKVPLRMQLQASDPTHDAIAEEPVDMLRSKTDLIPGRPGNGDATKR